MKIFVIAEEETLLAFSLAGLEGQVAQRGEEVRRIINHLAEEYVLVLVSEKLADECREFLEEVLLKRKRPLILEIPSFRRPEKKRMKVSERILSLLAGR